MTTSLNELKEYVDGEVRAVCKEKGRVCQVRRNSNIRQRPVSESSVEDYEWKMIPSAGYAEGEWEGTYYVLEVDPGRGCFRLLHDTNHCGVAGPHWNMTTYTEIEMEAILNDHLRRVCHSGPLRQFLLELVDKWGPNHFSVT